MRLHSKRLKAVLKELEDTSVLYDIGTDHAYLPIAAVNQMGIRGVIAVDNKLGPLSRAEKNVLEADLNEHIILKHAEGMNALTDSVDTVTATGLGGKTIYETIKHSDLKNVKTFIFQPQDGYEKVRALCDVRRLKIIRESFVVERGILYPIIVMSEGSMTLSERERYYGPLLIKERNPVYLDYLIKEYAHLLVTIEKVPGREKIPLIAKKSLLEEILYEWK
jgi:tRNA (adenine22-N1)-methyltransferase